MIFGTFRVDLFNTVGVRVVQVNYNGSERVEERPVR